jgi:hypothetical protein
VNPDVFAAAAWVTLNVLPAIVMEPDRADVAEFAVTE